MVTTVGGKLLPIGQNISEVSICCHSDTPVSFDDRPSGVLHLIARVSQGAVEIAQTVKGLVDESNKVFGL